MKVLTLLKKARSWDTRKAAGQNSAVAELVFPSERVRYWQERGVSIRRGISTGMHFERRYAAILIALETPERTSQISLSLNGTDDVIREAFQCLDPGLPLETITDIPLLIEHVAASLLAPVYATEAAE